MTEKERFIQAWENEFQTTLKVLNSFPTDKLELKPSEKSRSARELAWTFVIEEKVGVNGVFTGQFDFQNAPKPPASMQDIIAEYERSHRENVERIRNMSDDDFNATVKWFVAPKQMADVRKADFLNMIMSDMIHHRGQLSVYVRLAGGRLPSIYGPTADEPWM